MGFRVRQSVILNRNLHLPGATVLKGTTGVVASVSFQTKVRFRGLSTLISVSNDDIDAIDREVAPAARTLASALAPGDRVQLLKDQVLGSDVIPKGSLGTVRAVVGRAARVDFDDFPGLVLTVDEEELAPA